MPLPYSEKNILYLLTILECIEKIDIYTIGYSTTKELLEANDQQAFNATSHLLLVIGEEAGKLEESLKEEIAFIAWEQISGLRNRLAHDYRGTDPDIVFQVCRFELPALKEACRSMLKLLRVSNNDLNQWLNTSYFKHLGYLVKEE
jgi:uncharacterized protein with HEPN domain